MTFHHPARLRCVENGVHRQVYVRPLDSDQSGAQVALAFDNDLIYSLLANGQLFLLSPENPLDIQILGHAALGLVDAEQILARNGMLFVRTADSRILQVDVSLANSIHSEGYLGLDGPISDMLMHEDKLVIADGSTLLILAIGKDNPGSLTVDSRLELNDEIVELTLDQNRLLALQDDGFWTIEFGNETALTVLGKTPLSHTGQLELRGEHVYHLHSARMEVEVLAPALPGPSVNTPHPSPTLSSATPTPQISATLTATPIGTTPSSPMPTHTVTPSITQTSTMETPPASATPTSTPTRTWTPSATNTNTPSPINIRLWLPLTVKDY